jgi:hypothetical protein
VTDTGKEATVGNFYTDVIKASPLYNSPNLVKDESLLQPDLRRKVLAIIADATSAGHRLVVLETYRSETRQEELFAQGKSRLRKVGCHGYGLACDLGFLTEDGEVNWSADYSVLGHIARGHNLVWGGDWGEPDKPHQFRDYDHVQLCSMADELRLFANEWYPGPGYDPFA